MATTAYSDLDTAGRRRLWISPVIYDASSDQADSVFFHSGIAIKIIAFRVVCTTAWAVGTNVTVQLGTRTSAGAYASVVPTLAQMGTIGDVVSASSITDNTVDANTTLVLDTTKSGSMTGNYRVIMEYEYNET